MMATTDHDPLAALERAAHDVESQHHVHGEQCLCGFGSPRSRSRTEHLMAPIRAAIAETRAGLGEVSVREEWAVDLKEGHIFGCQSEENARAVASGSPRWRLVRHTITTTTHVTDWIEEKP